MPNAPDGDFDKAKSDTNLKKIQFSVSPIIVQFAKAVMAPSDDVFNNNSTLDTTNTGVVVEEIDISKNDETTTTNEVSCKEGYYFF